MAKHPRDQYQRHLRGNEEIVPETPEEMACERLRKSKIKVNGLVTRKHLETYELGLAMLNMDRLFRIVIEMAIPGDIATRMETQVIFAMEKAFDRMSSLNPRLDTLDKIERMKEEFMRQATAAAKNSNPNSLPMAGTTNTNQMNQNTNHPNPNANANQASNQRENS